MPTTTPPADPVAFRNACSTALSCTATIVQAMLPALDPKRRAGIDKVLADGGTLCVELSVDIAHLTRITMTVVTADGIRHEVASAHVPDRPSPRSDA